MPTDQAIRRSVLDNLLKESSWNPDEERLFIKYGDDAFHAILSELKGTISDYLKAVESGISERDANDRYRSTLSEECNRLALVFQPKHTQELIDAMPTRSRDPYGDPRTSLVSLLARKGDDRAVTLFLDEANNGVKQYAYHFLCRSSHPNAVQFLIHTLDDPKADPQYRNLAYANLAGTGGEEGLKAVLRWRSTERRRMGEIHLEDRDMVATKTDVGGQRWALARLYYLGNNFDLWLVSSRGENWVDPVFTGYHIASIYEHAPIPGPEVGSDKASLQKLLDQLIANPPSKDSDGDGLADLAQIRLGTSPTKADSDGDGIPDGEDLNPLAAPRTLTDEEQIYRAAFEAMFRFYDVKMVMLVYIPDSSRPMEFLGSNGINICVHEKTKNNLTAFFDEGVATLRFDPPRFDFDGKSNLPDGTVLKSMDRQRAKIAVSKQTGMLNGTGYDVELRKIRGIWVVVSVYSTWVS